MKRESAGRSKFFNTRNMCFIGLLVALILLMSFTPLGYLHIGIIEITFLMVPVAVGSIVLGPAVGAFLGLVFGITSFAKCFIDSPFGAMLFSIQPVYCFILCIIPRVLAGLLPAYIFKLISKIEKNKQKLFSYAVAALSCALLNTVFFVGGLMLLYGHTDYIQSFGNGFWSIVWAIVGINGIIEAPTCCIIGGAIAKAVDAFVYKRKEEAEAKPKIAADTGTDNSVNDTDSLNGGESGSL